MFGFLTIYLPPLTQMVQQRLSISSDYTTGCSKNTVFHSVVTQLEQKLL